MQRDLASLGERLTAQRDVHERSLLVYLMRPLLRRFQSALSER